MFAPQPPTERNQISPRSARHYLEKNFASNQENKTFNQIYLEMMDFFGLGKYPQATKKTIKKMGTMQKLELIEDDQLEVQARKLKNGRYWMWKNYISDDLQEEFIKGEQMFLSIHPAVLYDIQDYIIRKGMNKKKIMYEDCKLSLCFLILQC